MQISTNFANEIVYYKEGEKMGNKEVGIYLINKRKFKELKNNEDIVAKLKEEMGEDYKEIEKLIKISTNLKEEEIKDFHTKMWICCHGIATLVANDTIKLTDNQIQELLSSQFQALMLLEKNPNNKWILPKE